MPTIEDICRDVQQNFEFLQVGMFLSTYIKNINLSVHAKSTQIILPNRESYTLDGHMIRDSLARAFMESHKPNIVEYYTSWNGVRGVIATTLEGLKQCNAYADTFKDLLGPKYDAFFAILSLSRNVLSHNIDSNIRLRLDDFDRTRRKYVKEHGTGIAEFRFMYADYALFKGECNPSYGFSISLNMESIEEGDKFINIITEFNLYMLCELCANVSKRMQMHGSGDAYQIAPAEATIFASLLGCPG